MTRRRAISPSIRSARLALLCAALALLIVTTLLMVSSVPPPDSDAPRILVSLDRTFAHRLGFGRLTYARSVRRAGGRPIVVDYQAFVKAPASAQGPPEIHGERIAELVASADGLLLSGGGDVEPGRYGSNLAAVGVDATRDAFEIALLEEAARQELPLLAICRGAQLLNVLRGGTLQDLRGERQRRRRHRSWRTHALRIEPDSRLAGLVGGTRLERVFSWHGQAVERPGEGLRIVAWAEDGVPEALETADARAMPWLLAVQWHPELRPRDPHHRRLFAELVRQAKAARSGI